MQWFFLMASVLLGAACAEARSVLAHFMVTNADNWTVHDWLVDIKIAQEAHIDGFALNFAADQADRQADNIAYAFEAAAQTGFKLIFSFDYAGAGAWAPSDVVKYINTYKHNSAYLQWHGKPLVFEGPGSASDWTSIKAQTGCFFMPDWDSIGPKDAAMATNGVADGLFSWNAWPEGANDMNTMTDESYKAALGSKPYMMAASPWFYTNVPGFDKNWLWRGDSLWHDRWQQVSRIQPDLVQIVTWNDWPESSYIGPLRSKSFSVFAAGRATYNYAEAMPHDGWRTLLPYHISLYKSGSARITNEALSFWYRPNPKDACSTGGTLANAPYQKQLHPAQVVQDKVFFTALLTSSADISVSIGGHVLIGKLTSTPAKGGAGLYHGSVDFSGCTGDVVITAKRNGTTVLQQSGRPITSDCEDGKENWNAWTGSITGRTLPNCPTVHQ